jgi:hypothetical protein
MLQDSVKMPIHLPNGLVARWIDRRDLRVVHSLILGKGSQIIERLVQMERRFLENVLSIDA